MAESLAGRLLVATPHLYDPNFYRSVVWIVEHGADGALGVILNRPSREPLADHVPGWAGLASEPGVVFVGGPVSNEIAVGVADTPQPAPDGFVAVLDGIGLIDLTIEPEAIERLERLRIYSGYSGWTGAQLEMELASGGWFLADAEPDDVFTPDPRQLWKQVLRRQPGRLAFYASFPPDPTQN